MKKNDNKKADLPMLSKTVWRIFLKNVNEVNL